MQQKLMSFDVQQRANLICITLSAYNTMCKIINEVKSLYVDHPVNSKVVSPELAEVSMTVYVGEVIGTVSFLMYNDLLYICDKVNCIKVSSRVGQLKEGG